MEQTRELIGLYRDTAADCGYEMGRSTSAI